MGKPKPRRHKAMTKELLLKWQERMGYELRDVTHELGCTAADWEAWTSGGKIPRYIGLACAALALGMHPYGQNGE